MLLQSSKWDLWKAPQISLSHVRKVGEQRKEEIYTHLSEKSQSLFKQGLIYRTASSSLVIFSLYNDIKSKALHLCNRKINIYWTHLSIR